MFSLFLSLACCFAAESKTQCNQEMHEKVYIVGEDDADVFYMSDYTIMLKIGGHFYKVRGIEHFECCNACSVFSE